MGASGMNFGGEIVRVDWREFYPWAKDELPPDMPKALGKAVKIMMFADVSHVVNFVTRQSRTGILIFVHRALIVWYLKKQNSIKTSPFGNAIKLELN